MRDVLGSAGAVVAADHYAALAGSSILEKGGNAVDAAVATVLAECVVQPHNVGLGGYAGTMLIHTAASGETIALDFNSVAPRAATPGMFPPDVCTDNWDIESDGASPLPGINERGLLCVTVPPIVAGLAAALERFGTMPFATVARPAQELAEHGFTVYRMLARALSLYTSFADPESLRAILPDGKAPAEGDVFVQKDMAALIADLIENGPMSFYSGRVRDAILARMSSDGGIISEADFTDVSPRFEKPLSVRYGAYEVFTPAPPSGGLTALQILNVMRQSDLTETDLCSPKHYRLMIESARHAWADRLACLADPLFVDIAMDEMLSDEWAAGVLRKVETGVEAEVVETGVASSGHTVHIVSADRDRNLVSLTATHGSWFGSLTAIDGLGLVLGHGMSRFEPVPGRANSIQSGKRMLHNMSPLIITKKDRPYCAIGLPGGRKIVNVSALMAHAITAFGLTCGEAISLPRFHVERDEPALVESEPIVEQIRREFGPKCRVAYAARLAGPAAGVMVAQETDQLLGASQVGPSCVSVI